MLIVLDTNVPNGTSAAEFYDVHSDHVLEIGLTPNRADAASHIGVARDIKAAKGREIKWPSLSSFKSDNNDLPIPVVVEDSEGCPRYSAVTISAVTITESPAWLKNRLMSIGLTPINNVVDITNFVCHEMGQPLHAFDADQIGGRKVIVKTLPAGSPACATDRLGAEPGSAACLAAVPARVAAAPGDLLPPVAGAAAPDAASTATAVAAVTGGGGADAGPGAVASRGRDDSSPG